MPFQLRRRGVEVKLIVGNNIANPTIDPKLVETVRNANLSILTKASVLKSNIPHGQTMEPTFWSPKQATETEAAFTLNQALNWRLTARRFRRRLR